MPDIFLSYSREDQVIARRFAHGLEREGFSVWWDQTLHSGDAYDRITENALKEAKAVVVLWSDKSVESRWVRAEATMADRRGTFLPVMIRPCDRPLMFELTQAADLVHWKGSANDAAWRSFIADVRRFVAAEARAPQPAATANDTATTARPRLRLLRLVLPVVLLLVGAGIWLLLPRSTRVATERAVARAVTPGTPVSIAVLPFVDMTAGGRDAPLAEGLSEEISNWLAQIPDLQVVARTSSFVFKGANQDVRKVGKLLDATHVLEGSIRRGEGTVRITVQLVAAADGYHLWSRTFTLPDTDALRIEDAVSRSVAEALNAKLSDETERRWKARQAKVPQAQDLFLQGRAEQKRRTAEHNLRAMDLFQRAIKEDPGFALAYVSLAEASINSVQLNGRELAAVVSEITALLDRADALTPDLPETLAARGWLAIEQFRTEDAMVLMQRAVALNPNDADTQRRLGNLYARMAQPRHAAEQYELAAQLDPLDLMTHVRRCLSLQDLAEFVAAEEACARARELDARHYWGPLATSYLEFGRGDFAAALTWLDRAVELAPEFLTLLDYRVWMLVELGLYEEADRTVARLPESASVQRHFLAASIAIARQDRASFASELEAIERSSGRFGMSEWLELANLQLIGGDSLAARASLDRARSSPDWQPASLSKPDFVRLGNSTAIYVAGIELSAGNREAALQVLDALDATLDRLEKDGGACSGLYGLRAESLALRGDSEGSMANLRRAHEKGWRQASSARRQPYLRALDAREDYRQLLDQTERELRASATIIEAALP
jgi:TolB-like protein/Flp pilus assembly protein TadD